MSKHPSLFAALSMACLFGASAAAAEPAPAWIWGSAERRANEAFCLRTNSTIDKRPRRAELVALADYAYSAFYVNGKLVARSEPYIQPIRLEVTDLLHDGENTFGVCCRSVDGPAALMARLQLHYADGQVQSLVSGPNWKAASLRKSEDLAWPADDEILAWKPPAVFGQVAAHRWGLETDTIAISPLDDYTQWKRAIDAKAGTSPGTFAVLDGFEVELIRSAAADEDSWICLTCDAKGRWIIGMERQGLLRLTLPQTADGDVKVERINETLRECRGLVFAHNGLYAMANSDKALFRLRDTDSDDQFDKIEKLAEFPGDAGHGRNQLTLGPDGAVWGIFGDSVFEPASAMKLPPALANPSPAENSRSGFVARLNEDASEMRVVVRGLRNPFGLDFNRDGEMFTYDADAEFDMGTPWYRPTRINHLAPGGDYGWRRVTGDWPPYVPDRADMPQPTLDIGKGSPTAVEFAAGDHFPPRYREALFALDWAYGRILAVHLTPRGASYHGSAETFLRGQPLNVTDVEFGPDGAMYFVTGGRATQSAFYRVKYVGEKSQPARPTSQQLARNAQAEQSRATRRKLESLFDDDNADIDAIASHLSSEDPWIRHAARAALEHQPIETWKKSALGEWKGTAALAGLIALVRVDEEPPCDRILQALSKMDWQSLSERSQLEWLYLYERCCNGESESETPAPELLRKQFQSQASNSPVINRRLSLLLSEVPDENFAPICMRLLTRASDQAERMHYLFVLRHATVGWTPDLRRAYFAQLQQMDDFVGGEGMPKFRKLIRDEALAAVPAGERDKYAQLLKSTIEPWLADLPAARTKVVRTWTVDELAAAWAKSTTERDPARGQQVFAAARCIVCHRCGGTGGVSGPDLSSLAGRFAPRDILTSIVEPSKVISEKYASNTIELESGRLVTGRIAPGDYRSPKLTIVPNLLEPEKTVTVDKVQIVHRSTSPVSPMPSGLMDTLSEDEALDLLAYLLRGGEIE